MNLKVYGYSDGAAVVDDETGNAWARFYDKTNWPYTARILAYQHKELLEKVKEVPKTSFFMKLKGLFV